MKNDNTKSSSTALRLRRAFWFSVDQPTPKQLKEIESLGYRLVTREEMSPSPDATFDLGSLKLRHNVDALDIINALYRLDVRAIFGVFQPLIMREIVADTISFARGGRLENTARCYAVCDQSSSVGQFVFVGYLAQW